MAIVQPYIVDANIFMQASRTYYPLDYAKPFWNGLCDFAADGKIISIDKVLDEINEGDDELKVWANSEFINYFNTSQTSEVVSCYADMVRWAYESNQYFEMAIDEFLEEANADAWVLAYAKAHNCILVTHELISPDAKSRIPIPNVCDAFDIPISDTYTMLRKLGFRFA